MVTVNNNGECNCNCSWQLTIADQTERISGHHTWSTRISIKTSPQHNIISIFNIHRTVVVHKAIKWLAKRTEKNNFQHSASTSTTDLFFPFDCSAIVIPDNIIVIVVIVMADCCFVSGANVFYQIAIVINLYSYLWCTLLPSALLTTPDTRRTFVEIDNLWNTTLIFISTHKK